MTSEVDQFVIQSVVHVVSTPQRIAPTSGFNKNIIGVHTMSLCVYLVNE